jgi:hypothetical protein
VVRGLSRFTLRAGSVACQPDFADGPDDQRDEKGDDRREGGETKKRTNETSFPWVYPGKRAVSKDSSLCSAMYWRWTIWRWPMGLNVTGSVPSPM